MKPEQKKQEEILRQVDQVIAAGPYQDNWESLCTHPDPFWYQQAKFGIFIHWGVYSVPAFGNEWYPRNMYIEGSPEYEHHMHTYGRQNQFGYKDFIPLFKAEKFDAAAWIQLFKEAGARYIMPVAEHHDGFQMYDSRLSKWNARQMGPKRDILAELKLEAEKQGLVFCVSSHRAEHYWFMDGGLKIPSDVTEEAWADFYGPPCPGPRDHHNLTDSPPSSEHLDNWLARSCELVDRYRPQVVWFDWWIQQAAFKPYLKKFAAYYYNRACEWGVEVAINNKYDAYAYGASVFDVERGQLSGIYPRLWQNDTAIAINSWGYTENNQFKKAEPLIADLVDIVSKNGCLLLNVGPKADGTITREEAEVLRQIGRWLTINGEGIYGTTCWKVFGEGPTEIPEGAFTDITRAPFTAEDLRFTYKGGSLYVFVLKWPENGRVRVNSFKNKSRAALLETPIKQVSVLGYDYPVSLDRQEDFCDFQVSGDIQTDFPVCLKVELA